jgi:hypothetical protein
MDSARRGLGTLALPEADYVRQVKFYGEGVYDEGSFE